MEEKLKGQIKKILIKLANGYEYSEKVEEYVVKKDTEELELAKKKISTHYIPPDMLAIKMLLEFSDQNSEVLSNMTDDELIELKNNLIKELTGGDD